jgi:hypothetical protein
MKIHTAMACVMMMLAGWVGAHGVAAAADFESKEPSMTYANLVNPEESAIPPIDAAAPGHFETASFGLG